MKRSVATTIAELEAKHRQLDFEINELDRRGYHITPGEEARAHQLKKLRLATKDRLFDLRRSY
jgi:uncharacterized protein YdcH (DUF465 family)